MEEYVLNETERRVSADLDWADSAPEVQEHQGKLVIIRNRRVIAVGTDQDALLAEATAREQCSEEELAIALVPRAEL